MSLVLGTFYTLKTFASISFCHLGYNFLYTVIECIRKLDVYCHLVSSYEIMFSSTEGFLCSACNFGL